MKKNIILLILLISTRAYGSDDWAWLKSFKGSNTNKLVWDKRFRLLLSDQIPVFSEGFGMAKKHSKSTLEEIVYYTLGGPGDLVQMPSDSTLVASACRAHSCAEKGLIWANLKESKSLFAVVHFIFKGNYTREPQLFLASKELDCKALPKDAIKQVSIWLSSHKISPKISRCLSNQSLTDPFKW